MGSTLAVPPTEGLLFITITVAETVCVLSLAGGRVGSLRVAGRANVCQSFGAFGIPAFSLSRVLLTGSAVLLSLGVAAPIEAVGEAGSPVLAVCFMTPAMPSASTNKRISHKETVIA